jgi:hypothetical protein
MLVTSALVSPVVLQAQEKCTNTMHGSSSVVATNRAADTTVSSHSTLVKQEVRPSWEHSPDSTSSCGSDTSSLGALLKEPCEAIDDATVVKSRLEENTPMEVSSNNASTAVPVSLPRRPSEIPLSKSLPPPQRPPLTLRSSLRNSSSRSTDSANWGKGSSSHSTPDDENRRGNVRRSVSFGDHEIYPIEHVNRINRRERSRRWFNSNDLAYQRSENDHLLELMERTGSFNEKTCLAKLTGEKNPAERYTIRGLERQTIQGKTRYYEHYRDAVMAVLVQQQRIITHKKKKKTKSTDHTKPTLDQSESDGSVDAMHVIASSYRKETVQAQELAVSQGRQDAKEVRAYLAQQCDIETIRQLHERELRQKEQSVIGFLRKPFKQRSNSAASLSSSMLGGGSNHSVTKVEV